LRRREERIRVGRIRRDDVGGLHYPDAHAFLPARVHVSRMLDGHALVDSVNATHVLVIQAAAGTDENFVQRPLA
jgi:hypothetical protein